MRTLIVGSGFVGLAVARRLEDQGGIAVLASRRPPVAPVTAWVRLDVADPDACTKVVSEVRPDGIILVHGPSDVTWCEANPERAAALHTAAARNVTAAAPGTRVVLISTDNVFDGVAPSNDESTPTAPANAYGRAKLLAEQVVQQAPVDATVLRVSLVYGWEEERGEAEKWLNYFSSCAHRLRRSEPVEVPDGQWTTPVLVDDVAMVTAAVLPLGSPPLLHLGGPDRISRVDWADLIADTFGASRELVVRVPMADSRYACRPVNTCLSSARMDGLLAPLGLRVRGVAEGARLLQGGMP